MMLGQTALSSHYLVTLTHTHRDAAGTNYKLISSTGKAKLSQTGNKYLYKKDAQLISLIRKRQDKTTQTTF